MKQIQDLDLGERETTKSICKSNGTFFFSQIVKFIGLRFEEVFVDSHPSLKGMFGSGINFKLFKACVLGVVCFGTELKRTLFYFFDDNDSGCI